MSAGGAAALLALLDQAAAASSSPKSASATPADILDKIRRIVLLEGIPAIGEEDTRLPTVRGRVWRVLLGVTYVDVDAYLRTVALGRSDYHDAIVHDCTRTHPMHARKSAQFKATVSLEAVVRVMNAFMHLHKASQSTASAATPLIRYSQSWSIYAAIFLMHLPEPAACACLVAFLTRHSPAFAHPETSIAHHLSGYFEQLLTRMDPELSAHIFARQSASESNIPGVGLSAFSAILSLFGHRKPMEQVACIWDILLAFGAHMVVPLTVADLILKRDHLLSGALDARTLGTYNPDEEALDAAPVISLAVALLPQIPEDLYQQLASSVRTLPTSR